MRLFSVLMIYCIAYLSTFSCQSGKGLQRNNLYTLSKGRGKQFSDVRIKTRNPPHEHGLAALIKKRQTDHVVERFIEDVESDEDTHVTEKFIEDVYSDEVTTTTKKATTTTKKVTTTTTTTTPRPTKPPRPPPRPPKPPPSRGTTTEKPKHYRIRNETLHEEPLGPNCFIKGAKYPVVHIHGGSSDPEASEENRVYKLRINRYYGVKRDRFYAMNNGQTLIFQLEPEEPTSEASIRGEGWSDEYILGMGVLHWSLGDSHGAQHAHMGETYALELQLVHYAKHLKNLETASGKDNGVLITSTLFHASGIHNADMDPLAYAAQTVAFPTKKLIQVHGPLDLKRLIPEDTDFYSYTGFFNTKFCSGNANFMVYRTPLLVSNVQLSRFRQLRGEDTKKVRGAFQGLKKDAPSLPTDQVVLSGEQTYLKIEPTESLDSGLRVFHFKSGFLLPLMLLVLLYMNLRVG